jgi:hypothetical protein
MRALARHDRDQHVVSDSFVSELGKHTGPSQLSRSAHDSEDSWSAGHRR